VNTWDTLSVPALPLPLDTYDPCGHGLDPIFVVEGDSIVLAYRDEYCTDELGGEGEPTPPVPWLVIGTDTAGAWETALIATREYRAWSMNLEPDGTLRVSGTSNVYERSDGQWQVRKPEFGGNPRLLSDPNSGPDYALVWAGSGGIGYGRHADGVSELDRLFQCEKQRTWIGPPDFVLSSAGVPHVASLSSRPVPGNWNSDAYELTLSLSYPRDGAWIHDEVECMIGPPTGFNMPLPPDLELDADGRAHICVTIDVPSEHGFDVVYFTDVGGSWSSEIVGRGSFFSACDLELDAAGRVHVLTTDDYLVREGGSWSTIWSFDDDRAASLEVSDDGVVHIVRSGLGLLSNETGEWAERQLGVGYVP